jgi:iron-regulated transporter 1
LYLTVLSLSGQMVTYLLSTHYTSFTIALVRTLSVLVELTATWIAPWLMSCIGAPRAGMWFLSWQALWLGAGLSFLYARPVGSVLGATGLVVGTVVSRVGLWGFDLSVTSIVQEVSSLFCLCVLFFNC